MDLISFLYLEKIKLNEIKSGSPDSSIVVSDLAFSGVKSTVRGRSTRFGDIIHHLVS